MTAFIFFILFRFQSKQLHIRTGFGLVGFAFTSGHAGHTYWYWTHADCLIWAFPFYIANLAVLGSFVLRGKTW